MKPRSRREFVRSLGIGAAALPFLSNLPSLCFAASFQRKQRLVVVFSPNGVVKKTFWPDTMGEQYELKESLQPLEPFRDQLLILKGVHDKVKGDGDNHMRGIGCLLTGTELYPGNIQGGSHTPAGWSSGLSIDQEIKNQLQQRAESRTRFGSLEFGVAVPEVSDTWTRMVYAGPNRPIAPIDNPYQMFNKLYGRIHDQAMLRSVLDDVREDLEKVSQRLSEEDRRLLDEHANFVRQAERHLQEDRQQETLHMMPPLEPGIEDRNDNMPQISKLQIDMMVNSFVNDFARIGTLQYTRSVGGAKMNWLGIDRGHHELSHEPNSDEKSQQQLTQINRWYAEQVAYLAERLRQTPEPGGQGSLLDNTTIVWTNELGEGNSHTMDNIPFVMVGGGLNFKMNRALDLKGVPHNRLLLALAHGFEHRLERFGNPDYCGDGALELS